MKTLITVIFITFIAKISTAQTIKYEGEDNTKLYSIAINDVIKNSPYEKFFPKSLLISGSILTYFFDFLSDPIEAPQVKKYMNENNWVYFNSIDLSKYVKKSIRIKIKTLNPTLNETQLIRTGLPFQYTFSPIIFSNDSNKGILIFTRHGETETYEILIYYFIKKRGIWHIAKVQTPYLI